jgi:hypothetical protein
VLNRVLRRAALGAAVLTLALVAAGARPECAYACTCAPLEPARALAAADAAFVGRVVKRQAAGAEATLDLAVERRLKGDLGTRVQVVTARGGAACGIEAAPGARFGLFLTRDGDLWRGSLCQQVAAADLASFPTAPARNGSSPPDEDSGGGEAAGAEGVSDSDDLSGSFARATVITLAVLAVAGAGILLLRRRFRPD